MMLVFINNEITAIRKNPVSHMRDLTARRKFIVILL